jgi:hypothetical protein
MEWGALFILVLVVLVVIVGGGVVLAIAARGRRRQLSPEGGTLDAHRPKDEREADRPEHVAVETEQRSRFIGTR